MMNAIIETLKKKAKEASKIEAKIFKEKTRDIKKTIAMRNKILDAAEKDPAYIIAQAEREMLESQINILEWEEKKRQAEAILATKPG